MSCVSGREDNVDTIKIAPVKPVIEIVADYTDGSAFGSLLDGGVGVWLPGDPSSPKVVKTIDGDVPASLVPMRKKRRSCRKRNTGSIQCSRTSNLYKPLCLESLQAKKTNHNMDS